MSIQPITSHVTRFTLIATNLGTKRGKNHSQKIDPHIRITALLRLRNESSRLKVIPDWKIK